MADTQTATIPEIEMPAEPAAEPQRSRAEELLERRRAALEHEEAAQQAATRRGPTIELGELSVMLFFAGVFDLASIVPKLNFVTFFLGNATFGIWFWLKGVPWKSVRGAFAATSVVEAIPIISALPTFTGLVIRTYVTLRV